METTSLLERYAELTKAEPISTLDSDLTLPDTVVLEAVSPFYGYYNDAPLAEKQPYVYLVLDACHSLHTITRAVVNIRPRITHGLTADMGSLRLGNQTLPVIRIRDIKKYCRIAHIQKLLLDEGIGLKKSIGPVKNEMALISLQKFLLLEPAGDGLYLDKVDANKGYFTIPKYLDWPSFEQLTKEAKFETSILYFDAAQAVIFEYKTLTNLVRIYREMLAVEKLSAIRDRYLKLLA